MELPDEYLVIDCTIGYYVVPDTVENWRSLKYAIDNEWRTVELPQFGGSSIVIRTDRIVAFVRSTPDARAMREALHARENGTESTDDESESWKG